MGLGKFKAESQWRSDWAIEVRQAVSALPPTSLFIFICGIRRVREKRGGLVTTASPSFLVTYICGQFSTLYSIKGKRGPVLATG